MLMVSGSEGRGENNLNVRPGRRRGGTKVVKKAGKADMEMFLSTTLLNVSRPLFLIKSSFSSFFSFFRGCRMKDLLYPKFCTSSLTRLIME